MSNGKIHILDERYYSEDRNVTGAAINRFYQTYLGYTDSSSIYNTREECIHLLYRSKK